MACAAGPVFSLFAEDPWQGVEPAWEIQWEWDPKLKFETHVHQWQFSHYFSPNQVGFITGSVAGLELQMAW